ncbi:MAG: hypothetical protein R3200_17865 [Xanthomonadales bacterium]|nr:hypothetical protein [Xanthomonadales bacterium]
MTEENGCVECCHHGRQPATFVCQHLVQSLRDGRARGFWTSAEDPDNPRPDAWCGDCEALVNRVGEWNDESEAFAGVSLLCGLCYDRARALNGPVRG